MTETTLRCACYSYWLMSLNDTHYEHFMRDEKEYPALRAEWQ